MAAELLPEMPGPRAVNFRPVRFGGELQGALGGASQCIKRLGDRCAVNVAMPVMDPRQAGEWSVALTRALRLGARWRIVQVGFRTGGAGSTLVAGASQTGYALEIDGGTGGYAWLKGQMMSVVVSSQRYVYQLSAAGRIASDTTAELPIEPRIRVSPADNAVVELAKPYIEGALEWPDGWSLDPDRLARGFSFGIAERR